MPSRQRPASQPEASLARERQHETRSVGQQVPKLREPAPKISYRRSLRRMGSGGSIDATDMVRVHRSDRVEERSKGMGGIAWRPERSHSCPHEDTGTAGSRSTQSPGLEGTSDLPGASRRTRMREGSGGLGKRINKRPGIRHRKS